MANTISLEESVERLIDANLNRAREGLRVIEDWCRFGLDRRDLVIKIKGWRQQLGLRHHERYKRARCASTDCGVGLAHSAQDQRTMPAAIVAANAGRAQEALRVLEEFGRHEDSELTTAATMIRYELYDLEKVILSAEVIGRRQRKLLSCNLCLITSPQPNLLTVVEAALTAGVRLVQFRPKHGDRVDDCDREKLRLAMELAIRCRRAGALFIVNDRIDIALASDADGAHLGQDDLPTAVARQLLGTDRLLGRSTHSAAQIQQAEREGSDYLGVGPVYPTSTKPGLTIAGLPFVREAAVTASVPWFAIGGIKPEQILELRSAGADRAAVTGVVSAASDPGSVVRSLLEALK